MQVLCDEKGYVQSFALIGTLVDGIDIPEPADIDHFTEHFQAYRVRDGDLCFEEEKEQSLQNKAAIAAIREQREKDCFPVINRGPLWYERLTEKQKSELKTWYQAWLDAPNTGVIPDTPAWL